ncbi:anhydro-N-acetylmuramic acid kinase [Sphingorhabdus lutea]|uniref:Anhydro-N-acetylmuramic acid kinase n=2 Tax=Sphingorhabdus lutea TaxID=1913578 RepID=A0A1L3JC98_9SPHN|nr:anhydro-N-acetylmuramic acid kinase [Sphingorhabdus lutea]
MSGTSRDGIDVALLETDAKGYNKLAAFYEMSYEGAFKSRLARACEMALALNSPSEATDYIADVEHELTMLHAKAIDKLLSLADAAHAMKDREVAAIGFHGHTVAHRPEKGWTWQIGDAKKLAFLTNLPVIFNMRQVDVDAGGQGAPLLPVYHAALAHNLRKPAAILNLGGVANISWISENGEIIAFDTGMANALIDDWVSKYSDLSYDKNGAIAARGKIDEAIVSALLNHDFFAKKWPKSLDRDDFNLVRLSDLSLEDGAATLTAFTVRAVKIALNMLPQRPQEIYICGGGRHNIFIMQQLAEICGVEVHNVDKLDWNGDSIEAEGFAYIAARVLKGAQYSFAETTGRQSDIIMPKIYLP